MEAAELSGRFALQSFQFQQKGPLPVPERLRRLRLLEKAVESHIDDIAAVLRADLGKSPAESYETETGIVLSELRFALRRLRRWAKPKTVRTPLPLQPGRSLNEECPAPKGRCW